MSLTTRRRRRLRTAVCATIAASLLHGPATAGAQSPPAAQSTEALCANVPDDFDLFEDIAGGTFEANIRCLAWAEITRGAGEGDPGDPRGVYRPGAAVTRAQMATFVATMMDVTWAHGIDIMTVNTLAREGGENRFVDVDLSSPHLDNINRLARVNIVTGGPGGLPSTHFGPNLPVTRAQMATFIAKADQNMRGRMMPEGSNYFTDDDGDTHERSINAVASLGIAAGVGSGRYSPDQPVTRAQMSAFLLRTMAKLHADEWIVPISDYLAIPEPDLSSFSATDNGDGSATLRFDLRNHLDEPITGLGTDQFGLWRHPDSFGPWVDDVLFLEPEQWSFTEVGDGVYEVVHTSPTNASFVLDTVIVGNLAVIATDFEYTITGGG